MIFDHLSVWLTIASLILGLFTIIVVGSQTRDDARSIAAWALRVFEPMGLVGCATLALTGWTGDFSGGRGMVALCSAMIAAVWLGYQLAALRHPTAPDAPAVKTLEPGLWDDELA